MQTRYVREEFPKCPQSQRSANRRDPQGKLTVYVIKHTIEIAERPAHLSLAHKQLVIQVEGAKRSYACEDIGVLVLQHPAISLSAAALNTLLESGAVIVLCGADRLPTGMLLPVVTHTELVPRMLAQIEAGLPARKRLWQAIVRAKICEQAVRLAEPHRRRLVHLARTVKSGDSGNFEGQAARIYWASRFPGQYASGDKRDPDSKSFFNAALNYGYAIVRAATARALVSAGLQPAFGVFHKRRNNPFCLADDVMEPLRPMVDDCVKSLLRNAPAPAAGLAQPHRRELLGILTKEVVCQDFTGPLFVALSRYSNNIFNVLTREQETLSPPRLCSSQDTNACG